MLEDALRDTFAAKAGSTPPGSLDDFADAAIRGAGRIRRRQRAMTGGLAGIVVLALAALAMFQVVSPQHPGGAGPADDLALPPRTDVPSQAPTSTVAPPQVAREVYAYPGTAQPAKSVRIQIPEKGSVAAAYQAKDGYLVINNQPDGDKQLVLQNDDNKQQVLVDDAHDIAVDNEGNQVAWADEGTMTVAKRGDDTQQLTKSNTTDVPPSAVPVVFVGPDLVLGKDDGSAFDVWYTSRKYEEKWDQSVLRVFGAHPDGKSIYAEVRAQSGEQAMCLALLSLAQPFKVKNRVCGLPRAAKAGSRISPDGHWLAYPVEGQKQVAMLDLTAVFTPGSKTPRIWDFTVTTKTVWLNATTFLVDNGTRFQALYPDGKSENLDQMSADVVLIEPLTTTGATPSATG
ncbi:hypothetical protein KZZ52_04235 [Dactylosporangium sp. AC04546]|uniref:hypothetical protein n=1 Tax=Dactylosporangium sp. AC04546 TaxID=2862460 RepID=UPI001EE092FC|nr:hypothetical protein [Dactylosporangium sp. AC04546]WVK84638.1 hypothetical protein KZZ52_04235 [Dactylosporangium sp. AC04546]